MSSCLTFLSTGFPENQFLGKPLSLAYTLMLLVLELAQRVLALQKHLQISIMIMLDNFFYYNFPGKLFLGESKWSWLSQNTFKIPMNNIMLDNFYAHKCAGK